MESALMCASNRCDTMNFSHNKTILKTEHSQRGTRWRGWRGSYREPETRTHLRYGYFCCEVVFEMYPLEKASLHLSAHIWWRRFYWIRSKEFQSSSFLFNVPSFQMRIMVFVLFKKPQNNNYFCYCLSVLSPFSLTHFLSICFLVFGSWFLVFYSIIWESNLFPNHQQQWSENQ